ncbi:type II toxin-antitoxin system prevent-host-death family antitoxin [Rhizobium mongolense]|uniref:type II toxin-antitoxin system prevent-host-death family antitoxin n=1 Tax=Rhizobium mongolense TaxID=57676 RepID=UPI00355897CB
MDITDIPDGTEAAMRKFTTADLNRHVGEVTDAAMRGPVYITHHRKPRFVLMAIEDFERMRSQDDHRQEFTIDRMPADIEEGLLALADSYEQNGGQND